MTKIFILILNYNGHKDTLKLLATIPRLKAKNAITKTIIIDNGSTDESIKAFKNKRLKLNINKIIENKTNLGFAGGNNIGIKYALESGADYILLLNSDTIVEENFLPSLIKLNVDIAAPIIKFMRQGQIIYDYGGKLNWWTGRTTHMEINSNSKFHLPDITAQNIDFVSGTCMLVKKEVIAKIGLLPEEYFFYFEDVQFCLDGHKAGLTIAVAKDVYIYHQLSSETGKKSMKSIYYNLVSNFIFITKNLSWRRPVGYAYLILLIVKIIFNKLPI